MKLWSVTIQIKHENQTFFLDFDSFFFLEKNRTERNFKRFILFWYSPRTIKVKGFIASFYL